MRTDTARVPEQVATETRAPDTIRATELGRMETTRVPEIRTPDLRTPDTRIPEIRTPDLRTPDTRIPEIRTPDLVIRPPIVMPPSLDVSRAGNVPQRIPPGSITWYQGQLAHGGGVSRVLVPIWKYIAPEDFATGTKPRTLLAPPIGAINTELRTARDTIQVIGESGAKIPHEVNVDLGKVDIKIIDGKEIRFTSGGEKTNVGQRIASTTRGMNIDSESNNMIYLYDDFPGTPVSNTGVNRPSMPNKKPSRKGERLMEYERMTSLKGIRS
jgi:hypothetical protein